jgi:hypothetical protein
MFVLFPLQYGDHLDQTPTLYLPSLPAGASVSMTRRPTPADPSPYDRFSEGGETIIFKANDYTEGHTRCWRSLTRRSRLHMKAPILRKLPVDPV